MAHVSSSYGWNDRPRPTFGRAVPRSVSSRPVAAIAAQPAPHAATAFEADGVFGIFRVLARAMFVLGPDFVTVLALVALFAAPERIAVHLMGMESPLAAMVSKITLLFSGFGLQLATMHLALRRFAGEPASFAGCVRKALTAYLPAALIYFLSALGAGLAMLLVVVPGLMLLTSWSVILPAYLAEGGLFASFNRSMALTQGHRWKVFGVLALLGFALAMIACALMPIWGLRPPLGLVEFLNANWLMRLILSAMSGLVIASIYQELLGTEQPA